MATPERLNADESNTAEQKHPFFRSVRMTYVICAFTTMLLHHSLRSAINMTILCMVEEHERNPTLISNIDWDNSETDEKRLLSHHDNGKHLGDLQWNRDQEVLFPSVFFYGYVVALPFAGYFSDKYGGKALLIGSTMLEGAIFLLMPVCARANFWLAVAMRVTQGLIAALGNPARYGLFTTWTHPTERSASIAFGFFGFNIGNLITGPIVGRLCQYGWEYIFYIFGFTVYSVGFIMNWLVYNNIDDHPRISSEEYRYLKPSQRTTSKKHRILWKSIWTSIPVYAFIFTHFCHLFGTAMQLLMIPRYFKEAMGFSIEEIGCVTCALYGASSLSIIFAIILNSQVEKRPKTNLDLYHRIIHLVCCWAAIPFVVTLTFLTYGEGWTAFGLWLSVFCMIDIAFCTGYWPTISFLSPSYAALLIGFANCIATTTSLLVPFLVAKLVPFGTASEWRYAVAMLIVAYFLDGATFVVFGSSKLQPWGRRKDKDVELN